MLAQFLENIPQNCIYLGDFIRAEKNFAVYSPLSYQEEVPQALIHVGSTSADQLNTAIENALAAQKIWGNMLALERSQYLDGIAQAMNDAQHVCAEIIHAEQGKPLEEAKQEVRYSAACFSWFAQEAKRIHGHTLTSGLKRKQIYTVYEPVGVVLAITPWNFPLSMIARKVAAALAAGCTVMIKPSEYTPLTALYFAYMLKSMRLPAHLKCLIQILPMSAQDTPEHIARACQDQRIAKISFTGSSQVGKILMQQSGHALQRLSLELGGNAAYIITKHADLDQAVYALLENKCRNAGQTCVCANRILVDDTIADAFIEKLRNAVDNIHLSPLIHAQAAQRTQAMLDDALAKGAHLIYGGRLDAQTFLPTILDHASTHMRCVQEENFSPLMPILRYKTIQEALTWANQTDTGLASYVFTQDVDEVAYFTNGLRVGMVGVNTATFSHESFPFGGVKQSGFGTECSIYGIYEYLQRKAICWQTKPPGDAFESK